MNAIYFFVCGIYTRGVQKATSGVAPKPPATLYFETGSLIGTLIGWLSKPQGPVYLLLNAGITTGGTISDFFWWGLLLARQAL